MIIKHNKNNRSFRLKVESPKTDEKTPQKQQQGHHARMENRYPPIRQKRQGQQVSKEVKNYLFETTDLKTTTCI